MEIFIFKTDLKTNKKINIVKPLFNNISSIQDWSVDTEDIDNVLRIEGNNNIDENELIQMIKTKGFSCEILPD